MFLQLRLPAMHALHQAGRARGPLMLAGALPRPPPGDQPVLCGGEFCLQTRLFGHLLLVVRRPLRHQRPPTLQVAGVAVAVEPGTAVGSGIEVEDGVEHVAQQRPVVGDHHR